MFESFVIGAMPEPETRAFVAHVSECESCAKKLAIEAHAELAVLEVHAASKGAIHRGAPVKSRSRARWAGTGALALAAAVLLFVLFGRGRHEEASSSTPKSTMTVSAPRAAEPIPLVICPDGRGQEKCVEDAHRHGLFVSYPPSAGAPPLGGGRSGQGPNGSPFSPQQM
jgi:hypothetical protein